MKNNIILASNNQGKINEIKKLFINYNVLSLKDAEQIFNKSLVVNEEQSTFAGNAFQKASELYNMVGDEYICIGDDSGISIDALDGFPGVYTARWMNVDDHIKNLELLNKMNNKSNRTCHYTTVLAIVGKNINETFEYTLDGNISNEVRGNNGFGFDEIFELDNKKTLAEISIEEKLSISPRTKALEKVINYLKNNIN